MPAPFAETDRLILRSLEKDELPRLVALLDVWDVVRWLAVVPFPYTLRHAQEFYEDLRLCETSGAPEFYAIALKENNLLIGGVGLHAPRNETHEDGDLEIGYWLSKDFWGRGLMTEATSAVAAIGFARQETQALIATTAPNNIASQKVLSRLGLRNLGLASRDYTALRGDDQILQWRLTRGEWAQSNNHQA